MMGANIVELLCRGAGLGRIGLNTRSGIAALLMLLSFGVSVSLWSAPPRIGYIYPGGGQKGTSFEVEVGGQYLGDPIGMVFSEEGITVKIIEHNKLPSAQVVSDYRDRLRSIQGDLRSIEQGPDVDFEQVKPVINKLFVSVGLTGKNVRQLDEYSMRRNDPKRQLNSQIAESVRVQVTVGPDVKPGFHFGRIQTRAGLSNPMRFVVGDIPEFREPEAWEFDLLDYLEVEVARERKSDPSVIHRLRPVSLPATINGRILPGEVDEFVFTAEEGDQVVVSVEARSLVPYLADAVPGWFQAVVSLRDPRDRELAFSDDYRFNPDPVLFYKIPRTGKYRMKIHDSIYRGREDFVYRITVGELPFLTGISPLGGQAGAEVNLAFQGGNLTEHERTRFLLPAEPSILKITAEGIGGQSNVIPFHVDTVPEEAEREDNDRLGAANAIPVPSIINGVIKDPKDRDYFRVKGTGNRPMTFEVFARRLGSPLDSNLTIFDDDGKQIAWNDDFENPSAGLTTHHADARVTVKLPSNGVCYVRVGETQNQGSYAHAYRLKVTQGPPDVALRAMPSSLHAPPSGNAQVTVHALRLDGFDGPIQIDLKNAPEGYSMKSATILPGESSTKVSISVPKYPTHTPDKIELVGTIVTEDGDSTTIDVVPSEDMTQAFITKHIVPVDALRVVVRDPLVKPAPPTP